MACMGNVCGKNDIVSDSKGGWNKIGDSGGWHYQGTGKIGGIKYKLAGGKKKHIKRINYNTPAWTIEQKQQAKAKQALTVCPGGYGLCSPGGKLNTTGQVVPEWLKKTGAWLSENRGTIAATVRMCRDGGSEGVAWSGCRPAGVRYGGPRAG